MRASKYDVEYYVPGKKRRVAGSTKATSDFLTMVHNQYPSYTISQLYALVIDRSKYIKFPEAIEVLEKHLKAGYSDYVPKWR